MAAASSNVPHFDHKLFVTLNEEFPDAHPDFIGGLCWKQTMDITMLKAIIQNHVRILNNTNRNVFAQSPRTFNATEILKELLPEDAAPDYLEKIREEYKNKSSAELEGFLNIVIENEDYPRLNDYQRRQQLSTQQKLYTTEFNVEKFLQTIPDPEVFFCDPSRIVTMDEVCVNYCLVLLKNLFNQIKSKQIEATFRQCNYNLCVTVRTLQKAMPVKSNVTKILRKPLVLPSTIENIPLLQELAYIEHEEEIKKYIQQTEEAKKAEKNGARSNGLLQTCPCCYDEEVLPREMYNCENGCFFCKACIIQSTEVLYGEGKLDFPCLSSCSSHLSLRTLQSVRSPKLFSKISQKKALKEVKSAGIEQLEMWPFCDFATIPAEDYTVFTCLNPDCMTESCRLCKERLHVPLKCQEVEKDENVKARTYVENKMTEALLRTCWKWGFKFLKKVVAIR